MKLLLFTIDVCDTAKMPITVFIMNFWTSYMAFLYGAIFCTLQISWWAGGAE